MRRRPPHWIHLSCQERRELHHLVRDGRVEQRVARRARALLAMEKPETLVEELAARLELTRGGIWRLCRRYEERGIQTVYEAARPGRPRQISPPGAGANRATGLL